MKARAGDKEIEDRADPPINSHESDEASSIYLEFPNTWLSGVRASDLMIGRGSSNGQNVTVEFYKKLATGCVTDVYNFRSN